jgi:hypothetical protein
MLQNFVFWQIVAEVNGLFFQQDGAPAHFGAIYILLWTKISQSVDQ